MKEGRPTAQIVNLAEVRAEKEFKPVNQRELQIVVGQALKAGITHTEMARAFGFNARTAVKWEEGRAPGTAIGRAAVARWLRAEMLRRATKYE